MIQRLARWLVVVLLALSGALGLYNGIDEWNVARSPLQRTVTICVFLYGLFGVLAAAGLIRRARWAVWAAVGWALAITYAEDWRRLRMLPRQPRAVRWPPQSPVR